MEGALELGGVRRGKCGVEAVHYGGGSAEYGAQGFQEDAAAGGRGGEGVDVEGGGEEGDDLVGRPGSVESVEFELREEKKEVKS